MSLSQKTVISHSLMSIALCVSDIITKLYVATSEVFHTGVAVGPFLDIKYTLNRGISFSLLSAMGNRSWWMLLIPIVLVLSILSGYALYRLHQGKTAWAEMWIIGGGSANLIDRIIHGGVIDFIDIHVGSWYWPTFNIADICIVLGAILIAGRMLVEDI